MAVPCLLFVWIGTAVVCTAEAAGGESTAGVISEAVIAQVLVEIEDFPGEKAYWVGLAQGLIGLQEGDRFSAEGSNAAIDALKQSRLFRNVHVDSSEKGKQITLRFRLDPFRLIKDVKIEGAFPFFEREVLRAMTLFVGDTYTEAKLAKQESGVRDLFAQAGFPRPQVAVAAYEDHEDGHVVVHIRIHKGPFEELQQLTLEGNRAFSTNRLKWKMKTFRVSLLPGYAGRFVEADLKKDIEKLVAFYRKAGFADAVISYDVHREPGTTGPSVRVKIEEKRLYDVVFMGNETFWDRTLRKDLVLFVAGNKNDLGLKKAVRKIKERYKQAGYLQTQVKMDDTTERVGDVETRHILLTINEGPRSIVQSIGVTGHRVLSPEAIRKQLLTRPAGFLDKGVFVPETLSEDMYAIKALYAKHGFLEATVAEQVDWSPDKRHVVITLTIHEGVQTMVSSTRITGLTALSEKEAFHTIRLKEPEPFRTHMVQSDENALSALLSEKGYPHVRVKGEVQLSEDRSEAFVTYSIEEGPFVKAGQVYYRGNFRTKKKILDKEFGMKTGDPFSLGAMLQGQRKIRDLDLFDSVKLRAVGLKEQRQEIDLIVEVEEKKPYFFELGGGYESQKGLYAHSKVGDHNLFGTNKDGWLGAEASEIGYRAESRIREPRFLGSKIWADAGVFIERREEFNKNFGTDTYGASLGLGRSWFKHLTTGLSFRFERREQFKREDVVLGQEATDFDPRSLFVTTPSVRYDTRDSFIRPTKGSLTQLSVDISKGLTNDLDNFLKYRADFRYYMTPLSRLTFAWTLRGGYLDPYGISEKVPEDQLFFLGGTSDVRGFDENLLRFDARGDPLGGRSQLSGSIEARIDLGSNFEFALFYDVGRIGQPSVDHETADTFRSAAGAGLRYITPIGPIGVLYGKKLDPVDGENSGRFHFAIGYTF
jgi:outer membrane protein insertion porin family